MQMKNISNTELETQLSALVKKEREITHEILLHIQEVERRPLHLSLGYSSLADYLIKKHHYSEGSAFRRIGAMRMLKSIPEVGEKVIEGKLNLTQLSMAQTAIYKKQREEKIQIPKEVKTKLLLELENKSIASTESIVATRLNIDLKDKKQITHGKDEAVYLNFKFTKEEFDTLKECLALMSHQSKDYQELFLALAKKLIKSKTTLKQNTRQSPLGMPSQSTFSQTKIKPVQKELQKLSLNPKAAIKEKSETGKVSNTVSKDQNPIVKSQLKNGQPILKTQTQALQKKNSLPGRQGISPLMDGSTLRTTKKTSNQETTSPNQKPMTQSNFAVKFKHRSYIGKRIELRHKQSRYIPAPVRKQVFIRDKFQCQFKGSSGHICGSKLFLQPHHVIPFARKGQSTLENLSLRCRAHNLYEAEIVGLERLGRIT